MGFPRKFLNDNEEVVLERKPHWLYLIGPIALLLAGVVGGVLVAQNVNPGDGAKNGYINWATLVVPAVAIIWFILKYAKWFSTLFVLTTDRLILRRGVFAKTGMEIPLQRINNIASNQTVFERMIGTGDLVIESGGEDGQQRIMDVRHPFEVQNKIYQQVERSVQRVADGSAGRRELTVAEQIEKLGELVGKGLLTQAEFDAKKAQLLGKI